MFKKPGSPQGHCAGIAADSHCLIATWFGPSFHATLKRIEHIKLPNCDILATEWPIGAGSSKCVWKSTICGSFWLVILLSENVKWLKFKTIWLVLALR